MFRISPYREINSKCYGLVPGSAGKGGGTAAMLERFYSKLSKAVITEFDNVYNEPSLIDSQQMLRNVYEWGLRFPGNGFSDLFTEQELKSLLEKKQKKALL